MKAKRFSVGRSLLVACVAVFPTVRVQAQGMNLSPNSSLNGFNPTRYDMVMEISEDRWQKNLESLTAGASKLDRKAPDRARREYEKGVRFLVQKNLSGAVDELKKATAIYPNYVSAHNALGSAYLNLGQSEQAQTEFSTTVGLDDHLPYSFLNLGWAQLALKDFPSAQASIEKATKLAPLDLHLLMALSYAELLNKEYSAVIATAQQVHGRKHEDAAVVHYFAAAAYHGQNNLQATQDELRTFLSEAPTSPFADSARQMITQIKDLQDHPPAPVHVEIAYNAAPLDPNATTVGIPSAARQVLRQMEEQKELAQVEAEPESVCESCPSGFLASANALHGTTSGTAHSSLGTAYTLRSTVNEVGIFFAATDHGKSVADLTRQDVMLRDDGKPPVTITNFRNESQLPLRLGLVIDTSNSITHEFEFEQNAAASFLKKSLTGKKDLAFVVGFSNAVLLVQDYTADGAKIAKGIDQLAPAGGTALWDAVKFASDKLAALAEEQPAAKILVVISDGDDNSSTATLKEAIESAERVEVTIYTVSTRQLAGKDYGTELADRAMRALAERTGGAAFFPGSLGNLDHRLADLQEVIRSRYLISYKPADFRPDGKYRSISLVAEKSGHKFRVYARHGYYASTSASASR
jgi:Ca-activated chloride channel family protein